MLIGVAIIILTILISAFFSMAEISLASSSKIKLRQMAENGNEKANQVLQLQTNPGNFFTIVQIGLNAVAILSGIVGESFFSPSISRFLEQHMSKSTAGQVAGVSSFIIVTGLFILFADLIPKRLSMLFPEKIALRVIKTIKFCIILFRPFVFIFNGLANIIFRIFRIPIEIKEKITSDDVYAMVEAGAMAGVLGKQEHELIENVFELDIRTVTSLMTLREQVVWFDENENEESIRKKIEEQPHSKYLVCKGQIDMVQGYMDSKDMLTSVLGNKNLSVKDKQNLQNPLIIPDTLNLSDALKNFKGSSEDFAVIINEYGLVVGIITLNDIMSVLMGDTLNLGVEEQIVNRDENSWLIEGGTSINDVMWRLDIKEFPESTNYETLGGFMMYMLRRIPKRTDSIVHAGYKFEVMDIDNNKIDQILVTKIKEQPQQKNLR
jgi:CBS domain containing-hemolysin-like protein